MITIKYLIVVSMKYKVHAKKYWNIETERKHVNQARMMMYRKISNIKRTKSENLGDRRLVLKLPLANPLQPGIKLRMKM